MKLRLLVSSFLVLLGMALSAQITTSSISGRVADASGVELPGATVMAVHTPTGSEYGTVTNNEGTYTIQGMRIGGPYTVKVTFIGFEESVQDGIFLTLGGQSLIDFTLSDGSVVLEDVVVSANRDSEFNDSKTGSSIKINSEKIQALPTINRSINDYTRLTPQSNGTSFAGTSSRFNNYTIDGNIYNNNFGLGTGQFAGGNPISIDAIEAVSVNLAPYDVRYSGFTGAAVNAVTKSGTNTFKGSAYYLIRNDQMQGTRAGELSVDAGSSKNEIYGATIGGPIIKNKLFFFASYEKEKEAVPSFLKRAAREGETPDGLIISRVPLSEANFVRDRIQELYGYDTGAPDGYQFASEQERINARLDFNISAKHKLTARFNDYSSFADIPTNGNSIRYISTRFRNTDRTGIENINFRNNNYTNDRRVTSYVAELNSLLSNTVSNQFNIGYTKIADPRRGIPGGQEFPMIEVLEPDASGNLLYYMTLGNELFSVGNLLENNVFNITNNTTFYMDKHTVTAGINFESMSFFNAFNPVFNGFYRFNSYDNFVEAVINRNPNVFPDAFAKGYALDGTNNLPVDETNFGQVGIYLQDEFQVNERLKVTGGIRVDLPFYPIDIPSNNALDSLNKEFTDADGNTFTPDVATFPKVTPLISPRIGFNFDVAGDRSTVLRGGTGIFTGRIPFVWLSNQVNGSGVIRGGDGFEGQEVVDAGIIFNPDVTAYNPPAELLSSALPDDLNLTDRNFKLPQVWRTNLAVDQQLPLGIQGTLEFIYNRDVQTPIAYNAVVREPDGFFSGPDTRGYRNGTNYSNDPDFRNVFYLTNAERKADYYSITAQLSKQFSNGFFAFVAYTRSRARDLDAAGGSQAVSLWPATVQEDRNDPELSFAGFDQPNRVVANLSYQMGGTTLGLFYDGGNAFRYSYTYSGNFGDASNRLIYVPEDASELQFQEFTVGGETITAAMQADILDAYIDQDDYLSGIRGQIAERNGAVAPWVHRFDLRIAQELNLVKGSSHRIQLTLDFLNIGNLFNSEWGVTQVPFQQNLLNYRGVGDNNQPLYRINTIPGTSDFPTETYRFTSDVLGSAWRLQTGIRYIF
ncbi:carboxypeptidase regulatory-like domain-containing protein [Neolewinella lacunae]|uniref:TonB-dependent receptor n=1 Tax=Neolewinella lacunae TaxID=1517758 RepID=A0A923TEL8_9BACT|nr:carboxypeptidase regulatory-like domain-containing protein [Neolewinella lacunae]MBC6996057.1 TonB-dependent receptor [Neolewinella lacunae]MDN3636823.1 carboxypeptidase regulatory-like domain-containing protein [Neolewinella lacunae]